MNRSNDRRHEGPPPDAARPWGVTATRILSVGLALALGVLGGLGVSCSASGQPPLEAIERRVDVERFMGDWYVLAHVPIGIPFFSEENAYNAIESYKLGDDGIIATTYTYNESAFDGPARKFTPRGWVHDQSTNAEWRMQFLWPFRSAYLIAYLAADYQSTIIGVPGRGSAWIMAREPIIDAATFESLKNEYERLGYDLAQLRTVPQQPLDKRVAE